MVPLLRRGELLLAIEVVGNEERDVEEDLPVIDTVGTGEIQVTFLVELFNVFFYTKTSGKASLFNCMLVLCVQEAFYSVSK